MKTKISHLGRSTVSVVLAVMMLLSTMLIGTVSTVNAVTKTFEAVNLVGNINGNTKWDSTEYPFTFDETTGYWYLDITITQSSEFKARVNNGWDISFGASGGDNYTISESEIGDYRISVKDGSDNNTDLTVQKTVKKVADSVALTANPTSVKVGNSVTLTPTVSGAKSDNLTYTYKKTSDGTATEEKNADNSLTVTPTVAGTYKYTVTVSADGYSPVTSNEISFTATDSVKYYICGRFNTTWHDPSVDDPQFVEDESNPGLFYYETGKTIADLSGTISETYGDTPKYFYIYKTATNESTNYLTTSDNAGHNFQNNTVDRPLALSNKTGTDEKYLVRFNDDKDTSTTPVTIWLDTRNNEYKLWYTTALSHIVNVAEGVSATVDKATATTGEKVTVTAIPENGKVLDKVTVVGEDGSTPIETTVSGNTATFTMPDQNVTVTGVTFREANKYTVTFSSSDNTFGTVSATNGTTPLTSPATVTEGDTVTFTAKPKDGYALSGWTVNDASVSSTAKQYAITIDSDTTVVANFKEVTGTLSKYYLLCGTGATFKADSYTHVPLYTNEDGVFYADFDVAKDSIPKSKDYFIIFSTKEDTSGIIVDSNNVTVNAVNKNGFSFSDYNENVQNPSGGTNNVKFAKVYINKDEVTGFTIKITNLDLTNKKITYSAEPIFDVAPADTVEITAKDGTIRAGYTDTDASKTTAVLGDTTLSIKTPDAKEITVSDSYEIDGKNRAVTAKRVPNGSTVTVTTTIDPTATFAGHSGSDYYVKGFSVNGIFGGVLSQTEGKDHSSDVYTYTFEVNQEIYGSKLEITPVYFLKNDENCVYFYIENYDSAKQIWGNTPSCYVYYGSGKTTLEALGYYPGQPMVDYNGSIFTQIPKSIVNGGTTEKITGMTLNNYVWDDVHSAYNGKNQKSDNAQTYDYDDFVKIADSSVNADNIIYRFKYNTHDNVPEDTLDTSDTDADGWEVFLDYQNYPTDIFGNRIGNEKLDYKDTQSVTSKDKCLSIISDGYQNNYIGKYATAWSIYNKAGKRVATIPSSALLYALDKTDAQIKKAIDSALTPADFLPGKEDRDTYWATFKTLYNDYKGFYAQINFEAAIKGGADYGNRLDGRWYYTKSSQKITGEIKIQYANTLDDYKVGGFHEDTFADEDASSIVGTTTGASAYFTDPADRVRKLETEADNTQDYKFEVNATSTAAYTFVGWYRLIDGDYKAINPSDMRSLTGAVTRNSDVTLVARYIKTPGGSMTFHHSLYNGTNAGGGKATPEIQVVVKNNEGKSLYDSGRIAGTASIDKTKIAELAAQTGLTVNVTLYTTTKNLYNFNGYYSAENTTDITAFNPTTGFTTNVSGDRTEGLVTTSEYTFSFNEYYNKYASTLTAADAGTVYYNFYSDITSIKVPYKVQFSYTDRMGNQKYYNKAGYVDPENTSSYTFDENATDVEGVESHSVKVTLTNSFILSLAPYESNFTKNLTWNETPVSNAAFDSSVTNSIASAVVNSTQSDRTIHLNVFRDNDGKPTPLINDAGQFKLYEKDGSPELPYGSVFYEQNSDGTYKYDITAPKTYKDSGKELQFMYWAIYSDPECNNLVIKAYNSEGAFSYVAYDNCWIAPVYGESSTPVASVKEVSTSTQFMEVTRNQWTADNADSFNGFDADSMTTLDTAEDFIKGNGEDKLYADFVLNFFYNGKQLSVFDPDSKKVQTGIVMQKLELEKDSIGVGYNTDMKYYANKYTADLSVAAEEAKKIILTGESSIESLTKQINNGRLDNKNRLQYYARFNNTETNANCVYRVYTYIKYVNESNETVVELGKPIYFT
ncbi:InlB B-repeat-containing protein, partial [Ruminococcus bromii]|uniref:InlB B-repeat-containing protein n=1 Tax=Ruminococcus bromii TaxID=40518 RepID=UPI00265CF86D